MSERRVVACFPSIEKNHGRLVQRWLDLAVERLGGGSSHLEVVGWLRSEYGMGHGHANAIVGYARSELAKSE